MIKQNIKLICGGTLLLLVLLLAYANHFHNGFHFDDSHTVQDNVYIRNLKNIPGFFSDPHMFSSNPQHWGLRPLVTLSLAIDYRIGSGLDPFYFQLSTFVWYVLMCVFLFFVYKNILSLSLNHQWAAYLALFTTAWFTLHTANAETVNYIIARSDVLSTFWVIVSLLLYITFPKRQKWYIYVIPAFIGTFAKETSIILVVILFFYIILFEKKIALTQIFKAANLKHLLSAIVKVLPLLVVVFATLFYMMSKVTAASSAVSNPLGYYVLTQAYVWVHYVIQFFLPMNLTADSDWTVISNVFDERIIIGLIFLFLLVITIFKTSVKAETRPIAFGLIWFAGSLLPTSLVPLSEVTNDHRMFFAFIGLALSVSTYLGLLLIKYEDNIRQSHTYKILITLVVLLVLSLNSYGVYRRNKVWKDEETLWLDVTQKSPLNGRGLMNYGLTQMRKGNYSNADFYFTRALISLPNYNTLYINLGVLNTAMNKPQQAEEYYKKAIALSPNTDDSYMYYARFLKDAGRLPEAKQIAENAFRINPSALMTLNLLMSIYNSLAMWTDLEKVAEQTLALLPNDPTATTYLAAAKNRAPVAVIEGRPANAQPTAADYLNQSLTLYNAKDYQKCIEACKKALKLKPDFAEAYVNIGASYNMMQQWDKGIEACQTALKLAPNSKLALGNLNWALDEKKN